MDPDIGMVFKKTGAEMSDAVKWQDLFIYWLIYLFFLFFFNFRIFSSIKIEKKKSNQKNLLRVSSLGCNGKEEIVILSVITYYLFIYLSVNFNFNFFTLWLVYVSLKKVL
jgi:hypothetical protein